jgi:DNA repair protein SbcD/Mre11
VRSGGIGQAGAMRDKVAAWAGVVGARPEPLWSCLDELAAHDTQRVVDDALAEPEAADGADAGPRRDNASCDLNESASARDCHEVLLGAAA